MAPNRNLITPSFSRRGGSATGGDRELMTWVSKPTPFYSLLHLRRTGDFLITPEKEAKQLKNLGNVLDPQVSPMRTDCRDRNLPLTYPSLKACQPGYEALKTSSLIRTSLHR